MVPFDKDNPDVFCLIVSRVQNFLFGEVKVCKFKLNENDDDNNSSNFGCKILSKVVNECAYEAANSIPILAFTPSISRCLKSYESIHWMTEEEVRDEYLRADYEEYLAFYSQRLIVSQMHDVKQVGLTIEQQKQHDIVIRCVRYQILNDKLFKVCLKDLFITVKNLANEEEEEGCPVVLSAIS